MEKFKKEDILSVLNQGGAFAEDMEKIMIQALTNNHPIIITGDNDEVVAILYMKIDVRRWIEKHIGD